MKPKAIDLYCCAGGASAGLVRAGFDVVGVDIEPQPHYPFKFIQGDALTVPLEGYDFIWASPPCQRYSKAQKIMGKEHPDLVAPTRERLKESGAQWAIENVVGAPLIDPITLCGTMFGLKVYRHRWFECSFPVDEPPHPEHVAPLRKMGRKPQPGDFMHIVGNFSGVKQAREAMDIPWMPRDKLREAIPPAYAEYIGRNALEYIR